MHPLCTHEILSEKKLLEALNYMVSQGRFERTTFPLGESARTYGYRFLASVVTGQAHVS